MPSMLMRYAQPSRHPQLEPNANRRASSWGHVFDLCGCRQFLVLVSLDTSIFLVVGLKPQNRNVAGHGAFTSDTKHGNTNAKNADLTFATCAALPASVKTSSPPANRDAKTPAINSPNSPPNPGAPVAGANSFTEGQAKSRIEEKGFRNVHDLKNTTRVFGGQG